ncbi:invasion associated locus B family protein [Saccharibacter floricola]|uniref:Invasion protein B n=1 Tax=Saccharibacter floricola DSM 15669 TaxID=1123227 RepID=A0ABQ0NZ60_9PROT|nr:invasion associated locus B family protein [Saccharibacter floricola]GBQ06674.1 invasion protein B [Saccharibacter floricola DSM 15669]
MMKKVFLLALLGWMVMGTPEGARAASSLPDGVTSLNETYQDWSLSCHVKDNQTDCSVTQQAYDSKTQQRFFSIKFRPQGDQTHGVALLPFGLDLNHGLTVVTDGLPVGDIYSFTTCLPEGCIVPLDLDEGQFSALEKSQHASLSFMTLSGHVMKLPLSSAGLEKALERAHALTR